MESVDFKEETFYPLLLAIEECFLKGMCALAITTDSQILAALDRLCMTPEADVAADDIAFRLQFDVRVALCLNDYSRNDVRHALKKVRQSATRHNKRGGPRGYATFILETLGKGKL